MNSYQITLPNHRPFTMLSDAAPEEIPAAVFERFRVWPIRVV
jgi:hypothetical protein